MTDRNRLSQDDRNMIYAWLVSIAAVLIGGFVPL
jgi:hypothetical protein